MAVVFETIQIPKELYLRLEQLANQENTALVRLVEGLLEQAWQQRATSLAAPSAEVPPIYQLHEYAVDLGSDDLAQNIDHYLYGHDKQ